ncbi:hypothetical protein [Alkalihalobacillus pseudalcaliphilus]|uniref:Ppx/GppA phosphatase family protein n=1 Tax=Alkalihalobacillus pseudalcaliphilus TaxID=79884 RepID=UPI00064E038B|nr:hypothetical protein [Alkalihalobacillus pseudalcaliphilus]KMK77562.1 hypothetical protein AB990_03605 [Alkalihalobacillus pseudalcaliphilus]
MTSYFSLIEIHSNSISCIISKFHQQRLTVISRKKVQVDLFSQIIAQNIITKSQIEKTMWALSQLEKVMQAYDCQKSFIVATGAIRYAKNLKKYIHMIKEAFPFPMYICSEPLETYLHVLSSQSAQEQPSLTFNLHATSSTLVFSEKGHIDECLTLPVGMLTEQKQVNQLVLQLTNEHSLLTHYKKLVIINDTYPFLKLLYQQSCIDVILANDWRSLQLYFSRQKLPKKWSHHIQAASYVIHHLVKSLNIEEIDVQPIDMGHSILYSFNQKNAQFSYH